jgi:hypothetical protein
MVEIGVVAFAGGINALQSGPFLSALAKLQSQLVAESRDVVLNCLLLQNRNLRENNIGHLATIFCVQFLPKTNSNTSYAATKNFFPPFVSILMNQHQHLMK